MVVYISWKKPSFEYSLSRFLLQSTGNHVLQHLLQLHWLLGHSWFSILEWLLLSITKKRHHTKPSCNACEFSKHKRCPFLLALTKRCTLYDYSRWYMGSPKKCTNFWITMICNVYRLLRYATWVYFLHKKSEVLGCLRPYIEWLT